MLPPPRAHRPADHPAPVVDRRTMLVVEDDPDTAFVLQLLFDPAEFHVRVAPDLRSARALLGGGPPPDLVILDLGLPDGEGADLALELKILWPALPIVVLTARDSLSRFSARCAGADATFIKPTSLPLIEETVHRLLGDSRAPDPGQPRA